MADKDCPRGAVVNSLLANIGRTWRRCKFEPGSGRSPGGGNVKPLQYSCLDNSMDRGYLWATVHRVTKSQTQLSDEHFHFKGLTVPVMAGL